MKGYKFSDDRSIRVICLRLGVFLINLPKTFGGFFSSFHYQDTAITLEQRSPENVGHLKTKRPLESSTATSDMYMLSTFRPHLSE